MFRDRSVSRVLSCTVIYLGTPLPANSSDVHGLCRASNPYRHKPNLAPDGVYTARRVTAASVSSYLPFPSLQGMPCGLFLLHYPWSRLHRTLSGVLLCGARTFLMATPRDRMIGSERMYYTKTTLCCQPKMHGSVLGANTCLFM